MQSLCRDYMHSLTKHLVFLSFPLERSGRKISVKDLDDELCKMSSEKRHVERMVRQFVHMLGGSMAAKFFLGSVC